tara:strand:+ start:278 stop:430 length:153 start_codon:yes stop_codon:yes gene_type:complete
VLAVGLAQLIQAKLLMEKHMVLAETEPLVEAVVEIIMLIVADQCIMVERV